MGAVYAAIDRTGELVTGYQFELDGTASGGNGCVGAVDNCGTSCSEFDYLRVYIAFGCGVDGGEIRSVAASATAMGRDFTGLRNVCFFA